MRRIGSGGAASRRQQLLEEKSKASFTLEHEVEKAQNLVKDITVTLTNETRQLQGAHRHSYI